MVFSSQAMPFSTIGMKNIILALVVVVALVVAGYYLVGNSPSNSANVLNTATTTDQTASSTSNIATSTSVSQASSTPTQNKTSHMVTINTNYGTIVFETYDADAPNTVKNFITLAQKGFYNNLTFHRVIPGFMIQGGDPNGNGTGGPGYQFADELNPKTPSYQAGYKKGVVAMANAGPNTNGSQFFIMTADYALPNNYTIFGHVVSGQDVVDKIASVKRDSNDKPITPVVMKTVVVK